MRTKMTIRRYSGQRIRVAYGDVIGYISPILPPVRTFVTLVLEFPPHVRVDREEIHLAKVASGTRPADAMEHDSNDGNTIDPDTIIGRHGG